MAWFMTHVTCRLTAKNRDQLRNPTLGNWVWATLTFFTHHCCQTISGLVLAPTGSFAFAEICSVNNFPRVPVLQQELNLLWLFTMQSVVYRSFLVMDHVCCFSSDVPSKSASRERPCWLGVHAFTHSACAWVQRIWNKHVADAWASRASTEHVHSSSYRCSVKDCVWWTRRFVTALLSLAVPHAGC